MHRFQIVPATATSVLRSLVFSRPANAKTGLPPDQPARRRNPLVRIGVLTAISSMIAGVLVALGAGPAGAATPVTLAAGTRLPAGQSIHTSLIGAGVNAYEYQLTLTTGGNLEIVRFYVNSGDTVVIWQTYSSGTGTYAMIGTDGNFKIYNATSAVLGWQSGTAKSGMPPTKAVLVTKAVLGTDGTLTLESATGVAEWRSNNGLCGKVTLTNGRTSTAISAACREVAAGTWYSFDGGHASTPGRSKGDSGVGFDCSGLTRWAFYLAMNTDTPQKSPDFNTYTSGQLNGGMLSTTGVLHPSSTSSLRAGDWIWFSNTKLHHVVMYVGAGYIVEAYDTNYKLRVAPLSEYTWSTNAGVIRTDLMGKGETA